VKGTSKIAAKRVRKILCPVWRKFSWQVFFFCFQAIFETIITRVFLSGTVLCSPVVMMAALER
jgi:hypothetical protein